MHQLAHYDIRSKKCDICGLELRSNSHLKRHLRVHSGEKPFKCTVCGQQFAQRYLFSKFSHSHQYLTMTLNYRYNMMTHFKGHQGIRRPASKKKCTVCEETFTQQSKLDEHMSSVHKTTATTNQSKGKASPRVKKIKIEASES